MTHPLIRSDIFIETAFARRFQAMLRSAWRDRSWHVIVADPGAGKTMSIRDLVKTAGSRAVLAVVAPKNNEDEMALGNQFFTALGLPLRGRWCDRKPRLMGHLHQYGTECLVVDDAHDLSLEHLMLLKELTDQGRLQYDHPLGLCLVAAARGNTIPLKETLDQPDPTWLQWRRRLDKIQPFCRVASHTSEEVREILAALETVYRELFPQLNLRQWSGSIYTWLTQPVLDPANSGRVTMDYLMKLVTTVLEWTYQAGEPDVRAETLEQAAQLLVLRHDTLRIIDGAGPGVEAPPSEAGEQGNGPEQEAASSSGAPHTTETNASAEDSARSAKAPKCRFCTVIPIDLQAFQESGTRLVECPDCGATRTLEPHRGVLRFKSHDKRKTSAPATGRRWARRETIWKVVGG
jgi:AAA domain